MLSFNFGPWNSNKTFYLIVENMNRIEIGKKSKKMADFIIKVSFGFHYHSTFCFIQWFQILKAIVFVCIVYVRARFDGGIVIAIFFSFSFFSFLLFAFAIYLILASLLVALIHTIKSTKIIKNKLTRNRHQNEFQEKDRQNNKLYKA